MSALLLLLPIIIGGIVLFLYLQKKKKQKRAMRLIHDTTSLTLLDMDFLVSLLETQKVLPDLRFIHEAGSAIAKRILHDYFLVGKSPNKIKTLFKKLNITDNNKLANFIRHEVERLLSENNRLDKYLQKLPDEQKNEAKELLSKTFLRKLVSSSSVNE